MEKIRNQEGADNVFLALYLNGFSCCMQFITVYNRLSVIGKKRYFGKYDSLFP